ncbi:Protein kinase [Pyrus ussuriensis x Pyrus communis]|uniref:Protein kinase n=1 Tax=Pyrus ussuriensis x Pyrus communis TaxID=2448454 RepID=A0A5N5GB18_9ROSA|nr:Protein kinase [Pyrus ussuriensis x Pyrus communis]
MILKHSNASFNNITLILQVRSNLYEVLLINLISYGPLIHISNIKLIRTDTTLNLSQKADIGMFFVMFGFCFYMPLH